MTSIHKRFQNRVAEGTYTLICTGGYAFLVWLLKGVVAHGWWAQMACMTLCTFLLVELNNSNALLRVRSRMVACSFLVFTSSANFLFPSLRGALVCLLFTASLLPLFKSYQSTRPQPHLYNAFLCIGAASLLYIQILFFVPLLWLLCLTHLQSLNWRSFSASILGLLTPYWLAVPWVFFTDQWQQVSQHFNSLITFASHDHYTIISPTVAVTFLFVLLLLVIGQIHFWYKSFEDRIRVRQLYGLLAIINIALFAFLFIQPQHYDILLRLFIVCASPFVAHFFTLTSTKFTNLLFIAALLLSALLTAINLTV